MGFIQTGICWFCSLKARVARYKKSSYSSHCSGCHGNRRTLHQTSLRSLLLVSLLVVSMEGAGSQSFTDADQDSAIDAPAPRLHRHGNIKSMSRRASQIVSDGRVMFGQNTGSPWASRDNPAYTARIHTASVSQGDPRPYPASVDASSLIEGGRIFIPGGRVIVAKSGHLRPGYTDAISPGTMNVIKTAESGKSNLQSEDSSARHSKEARIDALVVGPAAVRGEAGRSEESLRLTNDIPAGMSHSRAVRWSGGRHESPDLPGTDTDSTGQKPGQAAPLGYFMHGIFASDSAEGTRAGMGSRTRPPLSAQTAHNKISSADFNGAIPTTYQSMKNDYNSFSLHSPASSSQAVTFHQGKNISSQSSEQRARMCETVKTWNLWRILFRGICDIVGYPSSITQDTDADIDKVSGRAFYIVPNRGRSGGVKRLKRSAGSVDKTAGDKYRDKAGRGKGGAQRRDTHKQEVRSILPVTTTKQPESYTLIVYYRGTLPPRPSTTPRPPTDAAKLASLPGSRAVTESVIPGTECAGCVEGRERGEVQGNQERIHEGDGRPGGQAPTSPPGLHLRSGDLPAYEPSISEAPPAAGAARPGGHDISNADAEIHVTGQEGRTARPGITFPPPPRTERPTLPRDQAGSSARPVTDHGGQTGGDKTGSQPSRDTNDGREAEGHEAETGVSGPQSHNQANNNSRRDTVGREALNRDPAILSTHKPIVAGPISPQSGAIEAGDTSTNGGKIGLETGGEHGLTNMDSIDNPIDRVTPLAAGGKSSLPSNSHHSGEGDRREEEEGGRQDSITYIVYATRPSLVEETVAPGEDGTRAPGEVSPQTTALSPDRITSDIPEPATDETKYSKLVDTGGVYITGEQEQRTAAPGLEEGKEAGKEAGREEGVLSHPPHNYHSALELPPTPRVKVETTSHHYIYHTYNVPRPVATVTPTTTPSPTPGDRANVTSGSAGGSNATEPTRGQYITRVVTTTTQRQNKSVDGKRHMVETPITDKPLFVPPPSTITPNTTLAPGPAVSPGSGVIPSHVTLQTSVALTSGEVAGIVAGCIVGFWIVLGPIVCIICRMRDRAKSKRREREREDSMSHALVEEMIRMELARGRAKMYRTAITDERELERLPVSEYALGGNSNSGEFSTSPIRKSYSQHDKQSYLGDKQHETETERLNINDYIIKNATTVTDIKGSSPVLGSYHSNNHLYANGRVLNGNIHSNSLPNGLSNHVKGGAVEQETQTEPPGPPGPPGPGSSPLHSYREALKRYYQKHPPRKGVQRSSSATRMGYMHMNGFSGGKQNTYPYHGLPNYPPTSSTPTKVHRPNYVNTVYKHNGDVRIPSSKCKTSPVYANTSYTNLNAGCPIKQNGYHGKPVTDTIV